MKKKILTISILFLLIAIVTTYYFFRYNSKQCLGKNEEISYRVEGEKSPSADIIVSIKDKTTKKELSSFRISNIFKNYHPIEVYRCGVYVIKFFNYNPQKTKQDFGFKAELWRYQYNGQGNNLFVLAEKMEDGLLKGDYSYDFRVDPNEKYLVLEKGYLGQEDYSLIIKDFKTTGDLLTLKFKDIVKEHPQILGSFGLIKWTDDGRYFWADIFDEAYTKGFVRIDSQNWSYETLELPNDMDIGVSGPLNFNTGYTILYPGLVWTGVVEVDEQIKEQWREEGRQSKMYLYNIFTKEKVLIETTTEPLWDFNAQWLSDTELQYEMPNGEKKIFTIH